jgi:hypothetical protein
MADPLTIASTAYSALGFLGIGSNPNDQRRFQETADLKARALAGDEWAYWKLRCLSGDTSATTRANAMRLGIVTSADGPCGYATEAAKANAKLAIGQIDAQRLVATGAGAVAAGATQIGLNTNPQVFAGTVGAVSASRIDPMLLVIGVGIVALFVFGRGK